MATPTPAPDHPANKLSNLLSDDFRYQLAKTPYVLPLEKDIYQTRLKELRDNWKYGALVQWCYLFKGLIKLTDHFDINSFEEELLQLNPPTFITRLKTQLVYYLTGERITNTYLEETGEFEEALKNIIPQYFLDHYQTDKDIENFQFAKLSIVEQINIYYELIDLANNKNDSLRKLIESKYEKTIEQTKPISILVSNKKLSQEEYFILPDLRLYYKELTFKKIEIPRKKSDLEQKLNTNTFEELLQDAEPAITKFTCLCSNIYQFDEFISSQPRTSSLYKFLKPHYDIIAENDVKLRKQELSRQRQIKLQSLMVHRKRSSRLEEKERRKAEDDERERLEYEEMKREVAANRAAKRMKLRGDGFDSREGSAGLVSRDERYRRKHTESEDGTVSNTPEPHQEAIVDLESTDNAIPIDDSEATKEPNEEVTAKSSAEEGVKEPNEEVKAKSSAEEGVKEPNEEVKAKSSADEDVKVATPIESTVDSGDSEPSQNAPAEAKQPDAAEPSVVPEITSFNDAADVIKSNVDSVGKKEEISPNVNTAVSEPSQILPANVKQPDSVEASTVSETTSSNDPADVSFDKPQDPQPGNAVDQNSTKPVASDSVHPGES